MRKYRYNQAELYYAIEVHANNENGTNATNYEALKINNHWNYC